MTQYTSRIVNLLKGLPQDIFPIDQEAKKPRMPPSDSDFTRNNGLGNWSELKVQDLFNTTFRVKGMDRRAVRYGNRFSATSDSEAFKNQFKEYQEEYMQIGKRPDLLIFNKGVTPSDDIANLPQAQLDRLVPNALRAFEVRSSNRRSIGYEERCSIILKVEDIIPVARWIRKYGVEFHYLHVFLDAVYRVSFEDFLVKMQGGASYTKPRTSNGTPSLKAIGGIDVKTFIRNRNKPTINFPIREAKKIKSFAPPDFQARVHNHPDGRIEPVIEYSFRPLEVEFNSILDLNTPMN